MLQISDSCLLVIWFSSMLVCFLCIMLLLLSVFSSVLVMLLCCVFWVVSRQLILLCLMLQVLILLCSGVFFVCSWLSSWCCVCGIFVIGSVWVLQIIIIGLQLMLNVLLCYCVYVGSVVVCVEWCGSVWLLLISLVCRFMLLEISRFGDVGLSWLCRYCVYRFWVMMFLYIILVLGCRCWQLVMIIVNILMLVVLWMCSCVVVVFFVGKWCMLFGVVSIGRVSSRVMVVVNRWIMDCFVVSGWW